MSLPKLTQHQYYIDVGEHILVYFLDEHQETFYFVFKQHPSVSITNSRYSYVAFSHHTLRGRYKCVTLDMALYELRAELAALLFEESL